MINPLLLGKVAAFLQSHPGFMNLITKLPKLDAGTGSMLVQFLERMLREEDPEAYLRGAIRDALARPEKVKTIVVSQTTRK